MVIKAVAGRRGESGSGKDSGNCTIRTDKVPSNPARRVRGGVTGRTGTIQEKPHA